MGCRKLVHQGPLGGAGDPTGDPVYGQDRRSSRLRALLSDLGWSGPEVTGQTILLDHRHPPALVQLLAEFG
jgi:hypothetical protein